MITTIAEQLARDEGRERLPYIDTAGWVTIGIGHNLGVKAICDAPPQFRTGLTDAAIDALFAADLKYVDDRLSVYLPWIFTMDAVYRGVLQNMAFNLGPSKLCTFTTFLALMKAHSWVAAAADLRQTQVYHELPTRYERLATQLELGICQ